MKITIIHGQSHKGSSYYASHLLLEKLKDIETIYEFFLPKDMPEFCLGCYQCMEKGETYCPHYHYLQPIQEAIFASDLLIFTTPVYCLRTTGSMKALLDHCFTWWISHRPQPIMYQKKAVIIASAAGAGMKSAIQDIQKSLLYWGISDIQTCGFRSQAIHWKDVDVKNKKRLHQKLDKIIKHIEKNKNTNHVSLRVKILFMIMRLTQIKKWSACQKDYDYWKEKGWLKKQRPWYFDE